MPFQLLLNISEASAMLARGGVPEKSVDFWGALQLLFMLSLISISLKYLVKLFIIFVIKYEKVIIPIIALFAGIVHRKSPFHTSVAHFCCG